MSTPTTNSIMSERHFNLLTPVTEIGQNIYNIHTAMLVICLVIALGVFGVMFYSIIKHNKKNNPVPAKFNDSLTVEIIWTIVPFLIVIGLGMLATKTVISIKDTTNSDITIKVIGEQWKWGYEYLEGEGKGINFVSTLLTPREQIENYSKAHGGTGEKFAPKGVNYNMEVDNELVVPVNKKIRIITTATDVIHAFAVPQFGLKQDAIPGFLRDTWFKADEVGIYRGQCSELCGKEHAYMPIVVRVVTDKEYTKWVEDQKKLAAANADDPTKTYTKEELMARGKTVFEANCTLCHGANGEKKEGGQAPGLDKDAIVLGDKAKQISVLLNGQNAGMPAWKDSLNDVEIASVITYTRNSWSNQSGEVQPSEITAARSK